MKLLYRLTSKCCGLLTGTVPSSEWNVIDGLGFFLTKKIFTATSIFHFFNSSDLLSEGFFQVGQFISDLDK
jgi:hypothetical protein